MKFIKKEYDQIEFFDNVFALSNMAKQDNSPETINATAGCLSHETGKIASFTSVYLPYKSLDDASFAAYAKGPKGNSDFLEVMDEFVLENKITLPHDSIATPGGTGAIYLGVDKCLDRGDSLLIPEISWPNYKTMAEEEGLNIVRYDIYNLDDLFEKIDQIEGKVFIIINSPCENPCGHRYTVEQHQAIIDKVNSLDKEVVLMYDIAYLDYAKDGKDFFEVINNINDNVLVFIAYSCSKAFSYYGLRVGVLYTISPSEEIAKGITKIFEKAARTTWSNINNSAMINVTNVLKNHRSEYLNERQLYIDLLNKRAQIFKKEADELGLEYYPYSDGFFITVKVNENKKEAIHQRLIKHHIYTVKVNKGLRVAICSTPIDKITGLAKKIYKCL